MQIKNLSPNEKNPRRISDEKLSMLQKAMAEHGDLGGIIYNTHPKSKHLVGGHQRVKTLDPDAIIEYTKKYSKPTKTGTVAEGHVELNGERFKYREVYWHPAKEKAAMIAANQNAGEWDNELLTEMLNDITELDASFDMALTMLDEKELETHLGTTVKEHTRKGATGVDEDEVPEVIPPRTQLGDRYQLGEHRLMCGDSMLEENVTKLIGDKKIDMVFTDPPYGMNLDTNFAKTKRVKGNSYKPVLNDNKEFDPSTILSRFSEVQDVILWGADYYSKYLPVNGSWFVWDKKKEDLDASIGSSFELCWSKKLRKREICRILWSGFTAKERNEKRVHPTQKPIALVEWFFERIEGNRVLDLFGGSGSTLIACEKTNRQCFMMELDPHYCDVIVERWEKYTGLKAKHIPAPQVKTRKSDTKTAKQLTSSVDPACV